MKRIPVFCPHLPEDVINAACQQLQSTNINIGKQVDEFERVFCDKYFLSHAVAVNSCTSALKLAYDLINVRGKEVITTPFTMVATNMPIVELGGTPVFADVEYTTGNIDADNIERRITKDTVAITCMHNIGYPCDIDAIYDIADDYGLFVVEDCAHAIGATYKQRYVGKNADFACFSFHAVKHITTINGGIMATKHRAFCNEGKQLAWFSMDREGRNKGGYYAFNINRVGYKMRMDDVTASMGLQQLNHIDEILRIHRNHAKHYREELDGVDGITLMEYERDRNSSYYLFPIHVDNRNAFIEHLADYGIESYIQHQRNDRFTLFGCERRDLPNTEKIDKDFICLPCHHGLSDDDVNYLVDVIKRGWQ